jgi:hypothetical protein
LAGTLLALFLLKFDFPKDRSISLIGHSLGTVIILECLKVLYYHYTELKMEKAGRIICDIYLWGGAAVLNPNLK